jgi:two-component system LytT family response regulator
VSADRAAGEAHPAAPDEPSPPSAADAPHAVVHRLTIRVAGRSYFVPTRDIDWIEGADYYVKLHVGPKVHLLRESLTSLERRLDRRRFFRPHRSAIVNLGRVREIRSTSSGDQVVVLDDKTRIKLTRGRRENLERMIEYLAD